MQPKIAYIMSRFPHLPETFILREMIGLEVQGWQIELYPLIFQRQPLMHDEALPWIERAHRLPYFSPQILAANVRQLVRHPRRYLSLWVQALWENRSNLNFLVRVMALFPKVVYAAELMLNDEITHIHAHYATFPAFAAWLIHRLTGISYSVTVHAHDIFVSNTMLATKLREAAFVVAISKYNRQYLEQTLGNWVGEKTHVIHCGINLDLYPPHPQPPRQRSNFEVVNIGSLQLYKGQHYLIQACAALRERGIPFRCRIIGGGELQAALQAVIREQRLEKQVELLGAKTQAEVAGFLSEADCYIQPSIITPEGKMEGIPVAIMEAMACALPVIATSISGIPELVQDGETGLLVPPADARALADALGVVYADSEQATRMGYAGRKLVMNEFDLSANVSLLSGLFKSLLMSEGQ